MGGSCCLRCVSPGKVGLPCADLGDDFLVGQSRSLQLAMVGGWPFRRARGRSEMLAADLLALLLRLRPSRALPAYTSVSLKVTLRGMSAAGMQGLTDSACSR
jgi:hypothetical protein